MKNKQHNKIFKLLYKMQPSMYENIDTMNTPLIPNRNKTIIKCVMLVIIYIILLACLAGSIIVLMIPKYCDNNQGTILCEKISDLSNGQQFAIELVGGIGMIIFSIFILVHIRISYRHICYSGSCCVNCC